MADFVLDASIAFSWCFPGNPLEDTPYSRRILLKLATDEAVVPGIWSYEIANIICVAFKRKRIGQQQIDEYLQLLKALPIRIEPNDLWMNVALEAQARRWGLSAYDSAYLDLALRRRLPIATLDDDLRKGALAEGIHVLV
jgi:predicted nucleic acid-binding protein